MAEGVFLDAVEEVLGARKGAAGERLMARLQHAQIALAVASTGTAPDRDSRIAANRELIAGIRAQLDALPDAGHAPVTPAAAADAAMAGAATVAPPPAFAPTHRVPPGGLPSWAAPDPAGPSTQLTAGLELEVVTRVADWAHVRASNGWTGYVDGRRLEPKDPPAA